MSFVLEMRRLLQDLNGTAGTLCLDTTGLSQNHIPAVSGVAPPMSGVALPPGIILFIILGGGEGWSAWGRGAQDEAGGGHWGFDKGEAQGANPRGW